MHQLFQLSLYKLISTKLNSLKTPDETAIKAGNQSIESLNVVTSRFL